tara:strand:- start:1000 stop:1338 length:339 start_codon:yes stop_codon:yes gene_type:complete
MKEDAIHAAIVQYLQLVLPKEALFWHTPNTFSSARPAFHAKLKRMGRLAGIPDLLVLHGGNLIGLEVKAAKGKQSPEQRYIEGAFVEAGATYYVVRSIDDTKEALTLEGVIG